MENAWQGKCAPMLASSSSSVASSVQAPSQISRNQIETSTGYYIQLRDVKQSQFQASLMTQVSSFSSISDSAPCTSHPDTGNSFLALLSGPPSQLQSDFQHLSNIRVLSSSFPANFSNASLTSSSISTPNWQSSHDPRDHNPGSGVDVCPLFSSRVLPSSRRSGGLVSRGNQDTVRPLVAHIGSGHGDARNAYFTKEGYIGSSNPSSDRMPHGSSSCISQKSPSGLPSFHHDQPSTFTSSSRVFCMNKSGDLLLSNTGLLAVVCSCHGLRMSISNFCEHSGLSNVIPGYAVHVDTGETIAQWRKIYFSKLGLRTPEDNRGWEWPEGLFSTLGIPRCSAPSSGGIKDFAFSDIAYTSVEPVYTRHLYNNLFAGYPRLSQKHIAGLSQDDKPGNSCNQHNIFLTSLPGSCKSNLQDMVNGSGKTYLSPNSYTAMKALSQGGSCNGGRLSSDSCDMVSQPGISFASGLQNLGGLIVKAQTNEKIGVAPERGVTSSRIELKLGQPSEKCRSLESPIFSATPLRKNNPLKIISQDEIIHKIAAPWETDCQQCDQFDTGSSSSNRKEKRLQVNLSKRAFVASNTNNVGNMEILNNDFSRNSRISEQPPHLPTSSGGISFEESTKPPNDSHLLIPWSHHAQHHFVKSGQSNVADVTVRPSNADKSAFISNTKKNLVAVKNADNSLAASETSFRLYDKQMEKMGFFNRDTCESYQHSPVDGKKRKLFQLSSMAPSIMDTSRPLETSGEKNCKGSSHVEFISPLKRNSSMGFVATFPSQEFSTVAPPATANLAKNLKSTVFSKNEVCVGPSKLGESLRKLALVGPAKQDQINASLWSNEHQTLQSGDLDVKNRGSLLDLLPSEGRIERHDMTSKSNISGFASTLFSPVCDCQADNNAGNNSSMSGANLKNLTDHRKGFSSYSIETSKQCHGSFHPLPTKLHLQGTENKVTSCETCDKCSPREYNIRRCNCVDYTFFPNKEREFEEASSICGLKKHSLSSEAFKTCASGINMDHIPAARATSAENGKVTGLIHEELKSSISQWRDVPAKVKGDCKVICTNDPAHGMARRGESGAEFRDFSAENDLRSSKIDGSFKGKELSIVSSGCSGPAVRHVSFEVNKVGSSSVDIDDPVYESDQVVDQGSAIDKCSDDATASQRSSEYISSTGKTKSIRDHLSKSFYNLDFHDLINDHKQCNVFRIREVQSHGLKCVKRKRRTKWRKLGTPFAASGVSFSSSECPSDRGDPTVQRNQRYLLTKDSRILPKSLEDSSEVHHAFSQGPSSKRRKTALSLSQKCSHKRDLDTAYDIGTVEDINEKQLKDKPNHVNCPDIVAVKRLKQDNSIEPIDKFKQQKVNFTNAGAVLMSNLVGCMKANHNKQEDFQSSNMKPTVCGMYGIISGNENFLRLPKIFSLSQVLKTARKCDDEPQVISMNELKKRSLDGQFCSFGVGRDSRCNKFLRHSRDHGISSRGSDETSSVGDWSVSDEQGFDKTKMNASASTAQFKPKFKAVRRRSLYELFMKGENFSSTYLNGSKNMTCTLPERCRSEMKISENVDNSNQLLDHSSGDNFERSMGVKSLSLITDTDSSCCVCGRSNEDQTNCLLECGRCSVRIHQACYGISRLPKARWYCRPCSINSVDTVCVLCGYGGGALTRASRCHNVVKSLLKAWNIPTESGTRNKLAFSKAFHDNFSRGSTRSMVHNSVIAGLFDQTVKQWIHMVCGLWTPGTRCPNVDTMSSFDVSGVSHSKQNIVCVICKRQGGSCIRCRVKTCSSRFHPWCAHLKGLLQSEPEGVNNEKVGFYGRCMLHARSLPCEAEADKDSFKIKGRKEATCARIEGYKGRKQDGVRYNSSYRSKSKGRCIVPQEQLNAWLHINRQNLSLKSPVKSSISDVEHDYKKEYARYKQLKGWKQLMVYKSGIHALGLYTSQLIPRGAMVVEYVGEIVGLRVADRREIEYQSGKRLQYKSACYFFRIDKEHIIDATRKGGIARFVNHSCTPNCVAKIITVRNEKKVVFFAQRDIYPGEEITYDYHFNEDEGKIPCFCNSRNCRQYLN